MKSFVYYEIAGLTAGTYISHKLGKNVRFASREKAIEVLEDAIADWRSRDNFCCGGELISENKYDGQYRDYRHQFVFKACRTGMVYVETYRVVEHKIFYNE